MIKDPDFDVFLAHSSEDKLQVRMISAELKQRGLRPWLDDEQIPPGVSFQDTIQQAISNVKSIAIFIGPGGFGRWQLLELKTLVSLSINVGVRVILVLLPGVNDIPDELSFLRAIHWVTFDRSIDDPQAIDMLVWGIIGRIPTQETGLPQVIPSERFDVYLCFQGEDESEVKQISEELKKYQIHAWPDEWESPNEASWQKLLTKQIEGIGTLAVFVGNSEEPWKNEDIESFIWECIEGGSLVIPIVLQNALQDPKFPVYLSRREIVNFRDRNSNSILKLTNLIRKRMSKEGSSHG